MGNNQPGHARQREVRVAHLARRLRLGGRAFRFCAICSSALSSLPIQHSTGAPTGQSTGGRIPAKPQKRCRRLHPAFFRNFQPFSSASRSSSCWVSIPKDTICPTSMLVKILLTPLSSLSPRLVLPARERLGNFSYSGNQVGFGGSNELQGELDGTADYAFCR